jgi:hypothetical protein
MSAHTCFECDATEGLHHHHVVPRSLGGTKTIPLCERCHGLVHSKDLTSIGALTSKAMRAKLADGGYIGGRPPYGMRKDGDRLLADQHEQAVIAEARRLRDRGMVLRDIAVHLAKRGYLSRFGSPFTASAINAMVKGMPKKGRHTLFDLEGSP